MGIITGRRGKYQGNAQRQRVSIQSHVPQGDT